MSTDPFNSAEVMRAVGRVVLAAIGVSNPDDAEQRVFVAGLEGTDNDAGDGLVPMADDFSEVGLPIVTLALGAWTPALYGSSERRTLNLRGAIWRPRVPLGEVTAQLLGDLDALVDMAIDHGRAFNEVAAIQSVVLKGGPGLRARAVPRGTSTEADRLFLTLPFDVEVKCHRRATPQPA